MLNELRIQNFKIWKDTGRIRLAPITIFFGTNSSGKSSIGQFLMMLKQTVESADRKAVLFPGENNSPVQLGSFNEMVFERNTENDIKFQYKWNMPESLTIKDPVTNNPYKGKSLLFESALEFRDKEKPALSVANFNYTLYNDEGIDLISIGMNIKDNKGNYSAECDKEKFKLVRQKGRPWDLGNPMRFYGFTDEFVAYHQNADFVKGLNLHHENMFGSMFYLGPLRTKTERIYSWSGNEPESVGYSGENTIAAILAARNRKINFGKNTRYKSFSEVIAKKLKEMNIIDDFKVKAIAEGRHEYEVKLKTKGSNSYVSLPDVGFGVSQVLPVITQVFYAPKNSIIIMEQPEIHLHPSAQSALADVMIDAVKARENNNDRNVQLIIETHSEHFLRRIQRRIADETISKDDVAAYFADATQHPAKLIPLQIDLFGNIENWPKDFFGDEMTDIVEQSKAALSRRKQQILDAREDANG